MRISDWSSDVCSSDLSDTLDVNPPPPSGRLAASAARPDNMPFGARPHDAARGFAVRQELLMPKSSGILAALCLVSATLYVGPPAQAQAQAQERSAEVRVGNEGLRTFKSGWCTQQ